MLRAGSPCLVQVGGSCLSLRADLAVQIWSGRSPFPA
jgi:Fe2+ transport system protein FeoA